MNTEERQWLENTLAPQIQELVAQNHSLRQKIAELESRPNDSKPALDSSESERYQMVIKDLESQLLRYRTRWYYVIFQFLFQWIQTWLIRLPLTLLLLIIHIVALKFHRFFPPRNEDIA